MMMEGMDGSGMGGTPPMGGGMGPMPPMGGGMGPMPPMSGDMVGGDMMGPMGSDMDPFQRWLHGNCSMDSECAGDMKCCGSFHKKCMDPLGK